MVLSTRISLAQFLQATVLLTMVSCASCNNGGDGGPPEPPPQTDAPIASVEIIPARVSVQQGAAFTLRARVKDQWGNVLQDVRAVGVRWATSGELTLPTKQGSSVVVTATPTTSLTPGKAIYVIASVDGVEKSDSSEIEITVPPESDQQDWIVSEQATNAQPSFAFLTGPSNYGEPGTRTNSLVAFAREGALEPFECDASTPQCGVVTLFSPGHAIAQATVAWTKGCDFVSFVSPVAHPTGCHAVMPTILTPLLPPTDVRVMVWTLANKPGINNQVNADKAYAEWVFDQPLIGLKLNIQVHAFGVAHTAVTHALACKTVDDHELTGDLSAGPFSVNFDPKAITVVYVDAINPGMGDDIGFTCPYAVGLGTLILVSADAINNSTLAHELGHALSQWHSADRDHPDVPEPRLSGFDPSNLMWSAETDWGTSLRRNLTLGQIFQMNLADFSFVKRSKASAGPGLPCSSDAGSNSPCPFLARDQR